MSIKLKKKYAYTYALIFVLLLVVLFKEQLFYAYFLSSTSKCVQLGNVCISLKKGWYRDYSQDFAAMLYENASYDSVDEVVALKYMDNIYKSNLISSEVEKSMLIVFQNDMTHIMKNINMSESEVISLSWGDVTITSKRVLNIDDNRAVIPEYNLIFFYDELKDLNEVNWVSKSF